MLKSQRLNERSMKDDDKHLIEGAEVMVFSPRPQKDGTDQDQQLIEVKKIYNDVDEVMSSKFKSSIDEQQSCPAVYEKLIQDLEADVRKHIRVQQQLKLHIEGVEDRLEELEVENEQMAQEALLSKKKYDKKIRDTLSVIQTVKDEKHKMEKQMSEMKKENDKWMKREGELQREMDQINKLNSELQEIIKRDQATLNKSQLNQYQVDAHDL